MFGLLLNLDQRRRRLLARTPAGPLRDFLSVPFPAPDSDCRRVDFVALDLETTGLNARRDQIISIGSVGLKGTHIDLSTARHRLVLPTCDIPECSAVIHKITDDRAASGEPLPDVLGDLLRSLAGKVLIAHYARIELQFLRAACERLLGGTFLIPIVDTYCIARKWMERRNQIYSSKDLRLAALREHYNLPRYRAHDALSDAVGAAELFMAQLAEYDTGQPIRLKPFLFRW